MKIEDWVKIRTLKIVNSRSKVPIRDNYMCQMDLRKDLAISEMDIRKIVTNMEMYFNVLWQDEDISKMRSVDDLIRAVLENPEGKSSDWIARAGRVIHN